MRRGYLPLYVIAVVVLVAALVAGLVVEGVSDSAVPVGTTVLGGLMVVLFLLSKRHESHQSDEHDQHHTSGRP
jgi:hypothetical protein